MLHTRHFLHPIRTVRFAARRLRESVYRRLAERQFRRIRRGHRDACWCGGALLPFKWQPTYGVCPDCGSYVNRRPPLREDLEKLYSLKMYWQTRQRMKGFPQLQDRAALYRSDGRLDQWLRLIEEYGPRKGRVVEVGCAPGVLLQELSRRGHECIGVEISHDVAAWLRQNLGLDIRSGFFPGIDLPLCHLFLAFDILEHSPCPNDFIRDVSRCLLPKGIAIIQTPIDRYNYEPPFGKRQDMFDDLEHLFLFTDKAMKLLAKQADLEVVSLKERIWLAGEICVFGKV